MMLCIIIFIAVYVLTFFGSVALPALLWIPDAEVLSAISILTAVVSVCTYLVITQSKK